MSTKSRVLTLTECSIMIALSTVLSVLKIFEMPYGGSITLASMLPIVIIAYRHGTRYGLASAGVTAVIQMLLGLKNFSYFTSPASFIALAVFDYVLAFLVFGLAGIFKRSIKNQSTSVLTGALLASVLRYICHVISGATVWAGLSIPTEAALLYSLSYNATYMLPETLITVLTAVYLTSSLDFRAAVPVRIKRKSQDIVCFGLIFAAATVVLGALIADVVLVFSKLQSYDGEFIINGLASVNWLAVSIVSAAAILLSLPLFLIARSRAKSAA